MDNILCFQHINGLTVIGQVDANALTQAGIPALDKPFAVNQAFSIAVTEGPTGLSAKLTPVHPLMERGKPHTIYPNSLAMSWNPPSNLISTYIEARSGLVLTS
jgi:hypothetical protein